jgi:hypothetical protein
MRHDHERHRRQPSTARQLDLFGHPKSGTKERTPVWEALPAQTRTELTALMTRLILDHARGDVSSPIGEARHEL